MGRLTVLKQIARDLAFQFGPECEIVIHDLKTNDPEHSIVHIENGHVTGRGIGDGPSNAVFDVIRHNNKKKKPEQEEELKDHAGYLMKTADGKILKCSTSYIRDDDGSLHYVFGINYDITKLTMIESALHSLVTAGPTQESIDPVRYITNHSSGKMGYALAKAAMLRGADVTLVSGPCSITPPPFVKVVPVVTAKDMFDAVTFVSAEQDIINKAAAVADYRPKQVFDEKVKKQDKEMSIELKKTDDILKYLGEHRTPQQFLCGFSMETQNMIGNSRAKLGKKHLDMVAANNLKVAGAGFQGDTNVLTLITQDEDVSLQLMSKEDAANVILDKILSIMKEREQ